MAKLIYIEKMIARKNSTGVKFLIKNDDGTVKRVDLLLAGGADAFAYGAANVDALYADERATVVNDGDVLIEHLIEDNVKSRHDEALLLIRQMIRNDAVLGDIITAVLALYSEDTRVRDFMTQVYQTYNAGTAAQQRQFTVLMLYLLTARG